MLQLRMNNYTMDLLISNEYRMFDRNICGPYGVPGVGYIRSKVIDSAMAPIALNGIGILQKTYAHNIDSDNYTVEDIKTDLNTVYETLSNTRLAILRIYTPNVEQVTAMLSTDLYMNPPTAVQELYNKCMDQARLRNDLSDEVNIKVKLMRGKHAIVIITDFMDDEQASDMFLTIGLTPVLFPDWKEKFNEYELDYFNVLVQRSQVKRISNVKANEAFRIMCADDKYIAQYRELQIKNTIEGVINNRLQSARNALNECERGAEQALENYNAFKSRYYTALETLNNIEKTREETVEEINNAIKIEGVVDIKQNGSTGLTIDLAAPVTFYNEDEAELVINNMSDNWVKQFFIDVFLEQKYKLMLYSPFYFDFDRQRSFRAPSSISGDELESHNAMFNPHLFFYSCLGDYKAQLIDMQSKGDLLMFNNIALASLKSINFRDGAVINRWKDFLINLDSTNFTTGPMLRSKCLIDADGNTHSLDEIYFNTTEQEPIELEVRDA